MKYFITVMHEAMMHIAKKTRISNNHVVQIDISKVDAFNLYDALQDMVMFGSGTKSREYASKRYFADHANEEPKEDPTLFRQNSFQPSSDENLQSLYGADNVGMTKQLIAVTFQVEANDVSGFELVNEQEKAYKVSSQQKAKLTFQQAIVSDVIFYLTAAYARDQQREATTVNLIDHSQLVPAGQSATNGRRGGCSVS